MKKMLLPLLGILLLAGCEKEAATPIVENADSPLGLRSVKRTVCHYTGSETNPYEIIEVADQSWINAHKGHGDAVDMDGDGYFDRPNGCNPEIDCDDTVYDPENSCCEDGYTLDFEGTLIVALEDEPGLFTWQEAIDACAAKAQAQGCGWYLPSKEELDALYLSKNDIGASDLYYWSSTEFNDTRAWSKYFLNGYQNEYGSDNTVSLRCRCVRR